MYSATTDESLVNINSYMSYAIGVGTLQEDWSPALQKANDDIVNGGFHKTIFIPQDIVIQNTFHWSPQFVSLKGNGAVIRAIINDSTKYAIQTKAPAPPTGGKTGGDGSSGGTTTTTFPNPPGSFNQATTVFEGLKLVGSATPTCHGLGLDGEPNSAGASHIAIQNAVISGFIHGEEYLHSAYMIGHYNVDICDNTYAIYLNDTYDTYISGERIVYTNCNFYNNPTAVYIDNDDAEFYFTNCSIDFASNQVFTILHGKIYLEGCHTENFIDDYSGDRTPFYIGAGDGNYLSFKDGSIQFHYPATTSKVNHIFTNNAGGYGGLRIENCRLLGLATATGYLVTGTGQTDFRNMNGNAVMNTHMKISTANNLLLDGSFEGSSLVDDLYIYSDTQAVQPFSKAGQNIVMALSTDTVHSGSKALRVTKGQGQNTPASFIITVPLSENAMPYAEMFFRKFDTSIVGNMVITTGFFRQGENGARLNMTQDQTFTRTFGNDSPDWYYFYTFPSRMPKWATHIYLLVDLTNLNGNGASVYFDDLYVGQM